MLQHSTHCYPQQSQLLVALQVLLTEELHGSLRKLRSNPMLLKDRYSSLQKRGIIEPRVPIKRRKAQRKYYQTGDRLARAQQGQDELDALSRQGR